MFYLYIYVLIGKAKAAFGLKLCKVYMNDDPAITLIYIMEKSNVGICVLEWG